MKYFCFILAINVLVLSIIPCCEDDDCNEITSAQQSHEEERANCSPFLTCETCTGFTFTNNKIDFQNPFIQDMCKAISITPTFSGNCISKIWQPPKLV